MNATVYLSKQQLDNMALLDVMMNTMSAAEKLVFGGYEGKKYAYYDEGNSAEWKTFVQLKRELQIQKECLQSMIKLFQANGKNKNFSFPENLSKEEIINDLQLLREEIKKKIANNSIKDNSIYLIYDDIIRLINNEKCRNYTVEEIYPESKNNNSGSTNEEDNTNEETVNKNVQNIREANAIAEQRDKENEEQIMRNNGKINYHARLFQSKRKFKTDPYLKNFYSNMQ